MTGGKRPFVAAVDSQSGGVDDHALLWMSGLFTGLPAAQRPGNEAALDPPGLESFWFLIILAMFRWAISPTIITELVSGGMTAGEIVVCDTVFSAVIMVILALAVPGSRGLLQGYSLKHVPWLFLCGVTGIFLYDTFLYTAMQSDVRDVVPYVVINDPVAADDAGVRRGAAAGEADGAAGVGGGVRFCGVRVHPRWRAS